MSIRKIVNRGLHTVAICSMMILVTGCSKQKKPVIEEEVMVSPIVTPEGEPSPTPTPILMTPAPGVTITPTVELSPTVTPVTLLSKREAEEKLKEHIDTKKYFYELTEDDLTIDGTSYYRYVLYDNGVELHPFIVVDRITGDLYLYHTDGTIEPFTKFPIDKGDDVVSNQDTEVSTNQALSILKKLPIEKLGLPKELSKYTIIADEWTTMVNTDSCYCFNVFENGENGQLVALYYVSTTGTAVYTFDEENGEFIRCD
ncbi:MAG: hypothetical protein PUC65_17035 [Clostridiales bacterium]|nr:hypothetical protein [Clostridiales bacterium]